MISITVLNVSNAVDRARGIHRGNRRVLWLFCRASNYYCLRFDLQVSEVAINTKKWNQLHAASMFYNLNLRLPTCARAYHFISSAVPSSPSAGAQEAKSCSATG